LKYTILENPNIAEKYLELKDWQFVARSEVYLVGVICGSEV